MDGLSGHHNFAHLEVCNIAKASAEVFHESRQKIEDPFDAQRVCKITWSLK